MEELEGGHQKTTRGRGGPTGAQVFPKPGGPSKSGGLKGGGGGAQLWGGGGVLGAGGGDAALL